MSKKRSKGKKIALDIVGTLLLAVIVTGGIFAVKVNEFEKTVKNYEIKKADMVVDTYGDPNDPTLLLMHGMYMDGKMLADYCMDLANDYYLIVPTYHGMEGNQETVFESMDGECQYIEDYLKAEQGGHDNHAFHIEMYAINEQLSMPFKKLKDLKNKISLHYKCQCKCGRIHYYNVKTIESKPQYCYYPVPISTKWTYSVAAQKATMRKRDNYEGKECVALKDDELKREYVKKHGIRLIEISYKDKEISKVYEILQKEGVVETN